jgi:hypothetical protein
VEGQKGMLRRVFSLQSAFKNSANGGQRLAFANCSKFSAKEAGSFDK